MHDTQSKKKLKKHSMLPISDRLFSDANYFWHKWCGGMIDLDRAGACSIYGAPEVVIGHRSI